MLRNFLLVGFGGAIGSMLRYAGNLLVVNKYFPFSTFFINIVGSCIIGIVIGLSVKSETFNDNWKLFLATGICGGFTTFSSFSSENMELLREGKIALCFSYIVSSVTFGIAAAWAGFKLIN